MYYVLLVAVLVFAGCSQDFRAKHAKAVQSGLQKIPEAGEIERLFGDSDHFITHFGMNDGKATKTWNTEVYFGGRYVLTMQVQVVVDDAADVVTSVAETSLFVLKEFRGVERLPSGVHSASFMDDRKFGLEEWKQFSTNSTWQGKSLAGKTLVPDKPVENFQGFVDSIRRDRKN